ncbi:hypothetical protein SCHPADRAFT_756974 [Schizopora paradoxa]|uniref:DUF6532 domain-containing protein n=1 Tax=Schizopora paradoxa TaxID=27342 RepID=A0A0H2QZ96_9AGAM|nr:hypothetical protein SCHPADRAFT_756974 [Schizopora paradoxa]
MYKERFGLNPTLASSRLDLEGASSGEESAENFISKGRAPVVQHGHRAADARKIMQPRASKSHRRRHRVQSASQQAKSSIVGQSAFRTSNNNSNRNVEISDVDESRATQTKRRNVKKRNGPGSLARSTSGGRARRLANNPAERRVVTPDKLKYYTGSLADLLKEAIFNARCYLFTSNGYPSPSKLYKVGKYSYRAACRSKYGPGWKEKMPELTEGMLKLIRDENWGIRGKIKKAVLGVVDRAYGLHPHESAFKVTSPKALRNAKRLHIAKTVKHLLGGDAPYLRGRKTKDYPIGVAFANLAIKDLIHLLVFDPKHSKPPLASRRLKHFRTIPLPLLAYASTALHHGLEAYRTGRYIASQFSETSYRSYYLELLRSLREMDTSEEDRPFLDTIRKHIFETGMALMQGRVSSLVKRSVPFRASTGQRIELQSDTEIYDSELESEVESSGESFEECSRNISDDENSEDDEQENSDENKSSSEVGPGAEGTYESDTDDDENSNADEVRNGETLSGEGRSDDDRESSGEEGSSGEYTSGEEGQSEDEGGSEHDEEESGDEE